MSTPLVDHAAVPGARHALTIARRLLYIEASDVAWIVSCGCGFRSVTNECAEAQRIADQHRAAKHRHQYNEARKKRRRQARALG